MKDFYDFPAHVGHVVVVTSTKMGGKGVLMTTTATRGR